MTTMNSARQAAAQLDALRRSLGSLGRWEVFDIRRELAESLEAADRRLMDIRLDEKAKSVAEQLAAKERRMIVRQQQQDELCIRRQDALAMREGGATLKEIGASLGVSVSRAQSICERAKRERDRHNSED